MQISATLVKELREKTGAGLMNCKKALSESDGNIDEAVKLLREKGMATASKKASRDASEGRVFIQSNANKTQALVLELNCETDFVAGNSEFSVFGNTIATAILENSSMNSVTEVESLTIDGKTYEELVSEYTLKLGEKIGIKKFVRVNSSFPIFSYIHSNGKIGTAVSFDTAIEEGLGKSIAMQVAASSPRCVKRDQVDPNDIEQEKTIIKKMAENENRPEKIIDKIISGKLEKFFKEICLLEQAYILDDKQSVQSALGSGTVVEFVRYAIGTADS